MEFVLLLVVDFGLINLDGGYGWYIFVYVFKKVVIYGE